ncbi:CGNR zinc finger domain-containing protein [Thermoflavimicrobium dichotomicum]|uniref:Conserved protein containing a Zn-ribbon-like motif, possibly RNA-binding n=1 Tax=Thermoflavimicrobium dichotomicum TaxID=46223 RepID=A0A1I3V3T3_9BACL|nr:CGNR zinc finger domain-containing protein [Thermoflavimicrobium dichotomicum]SFJ88791.1 Conserved protein containing a Zn-ribbon-like motif, possibly RNA-binding [Thermoflavimicrobium dichotomicum]
MDILCIDFMNSDWRDWRGSGRREDRLYQTAWIESFLQKWEFEAPIPPDPETLMTLRKLRDGMRSIVEALVENKPAQQVDIDQLNQALQHAQTYPQLYWHKEGFRMEQVSSAHGWPFVISQIAASFAELVTYEDVRRIKICANDDCRWIFFDESRNRARHWCDSRLCGNLLKVRRFRAKKKTDKES